MISALMQARQLLADVTPLTQDCGALCGAACCRSLEGETTGMLLFPGEESLLQGEEGYRFLATEHGTLLICAGHCRRSMRPLACMLYPLLPLLREGCVKVGMNAAAHGHCPLARMGVKGLDPEFRRRMRQAGELLCSEPSLRAHLQQLTEEHDEIKSLREMWGLHSS